MSVLDDIFGGLSGGLSGAVQGYQIGQEIKDKNAQRANVLQELQLRNSEHDDLQTQRSDAAAARAQAEKDKAAAAIDAKKQRDWEAGLEVLKLMPPGPAKEAFGSNLLKTRFPGANVDGDPSAASPPAVAAVAPVSAPTSATPSGPSDVMAPRPGAGAALSPNALPAGPTGPPGGPTGMPPTGAGGVPPGGAAPPMTTPAPSGGATSPNAGAPPSVLDRLAKPARPSLFSPSLADSAPDYSHKIAIQAFRDKNSRDPNADDLIAIDKQLRSDTKPPAVGTFEDYVTRKFGPTPTAANVTKARQDWEAAGRAPQPAPGNYTIAPNTPDFTTAQNLAYGKLTFSQFRTLVAYGRDPEKKMALYAKATELNPDFNPAAFEMGFKFAANPQTQKALAAVDNVMPNVDRITDLSEAWDRTQYPDVNKFLGAVKFKLGDKTVANLRQAQKLVGDELGVALGAGGMSDMKLQLGLDVVDPNLAPEQFVSNMARVKEFLVNRKQSLLKQMGVYGQPGMNPGAGPAPSGGSGPQASAPGGGGATAPTALQQVTSRAPGAASTAPSATKRQPTVGERRTINGQVAEWDGRGWKAVQ